MAEEKVVLDPLNTETDFEKWKELRNGTAQPAVDEAEGVESTDETSVESSTTEQDTQEKKPDKNSIKERIKHYSDRAHKAEEDAEKLRRELDEARKAKPEPVRESPKPDPKPEAKADEAPKLKDFTKQVDKFDTYEDAHEAWVEARDAWRDNKVKAEREQEKVATDRQKAAESVATKTQKTREKYADFDEAVRPVDYSKLPSVMSSYMIDSDHTGEFIYHFAKNTAEMARIAAIQNPYHQARELAKIEFSFEQSEEPPEPKKQPVTKAPAPVRNITSGGSPGKPKDPNEIDNFDEYRKLMGPGLRSTR